MEKAPIKKFAVEARRKLIADVTFQLERYGITEKRHRGAADQHGQGAGV